MKQKQPNLWHAMDGKETADALQTDIYKGLTRKEATKRKMASLGANVLWRVKRASVTHTAFGEFFDLAAILLIITAVVAALFERGDEAVVLALILVFSALIRTAMHVVAKRIFEDAARSNLPRASVIRDGKLRSVSADSVVEGDVLLFSAGDPVTADVRLISGEVYVSEGGITENRGIQKKNADAVLPPDAVCEARTNVLFAGSTVLSGSGRGIAIASGEDTYLYAKRGYIDIPAGEDIPILSRLSMWCRNVSLIMIGVVLVITLGGVLIGHSTVSFDALFLSALSLAVASMSEFLCVIASIILAVSVQKLKTQTKNAVTLRRADTIERFAHTQCIVLDGARLLQSGNVRLGSAYVNGRDIEVTDLYTSPEALHLLTLALLCRSGSINPVLSSGDASRMDVRSEMLRFIHRDFPDEMRTSDSQPAVIAADHSGRVHTLLAQSHSETVAYICGEVEDVLSCCSGIIIGGEAKPFSDAMKSDLIEKARLCRKQSARTVAIASRVSPYTNFSKLSALQTKMQFMGLFSVVDPVEAEMLLLLKKCKDAGISLAVMSSAPETDREVLTASGVFSERDDPAKTIGEVSAFAAAVSQADSVPREIWIHIKSTSERAKMLKAITEHLPNAVFVCDSLSGLPLCTGNQLSVATEGRFSSSPQCLNQAASASVSYDEDERVAGAAHVVRIVSYCRSAFVRLRNAAEYLLCIQSLRLTLMLAAAFFGLPLLTPVQALWWGLVLDFSAVLTFAFADTDADVLTYPRDEMEFPTVRHGIAFPLSLGVFGGVVLCACCVFLARLSPAADALSCMYGGGVLASFTLLIAILFFRKGRRRRSVHINAASALYAALVLITLVQSCITREYMFYLFLPVCAILLPCVRLLYRILASRN